MSLSIQDVLALDALSVGAPRVVAGEERLSSRVRWVHTTDLTDVAYSLRGAELLLSTGTGIPEEYEACEAYIQSLVIAGACGVVIQLGPRFTAGIPQRLIRAAKRAGLPLIELRRPVQFTDVAESANTLLVDGRLRQLNASEVVHRTFNELTVEGAEPDYIVRELAHLSRRPVILENLAHQVLAFDHAGYSAPVLLSDWERQSRSVRTSVRVGRDEKSGWLVAMVGARGSDWGRLLMMDEVDSEDRNELEWRLLMLERGASALALNHLISSRSHSLERQTHTVLVNAIRTHSLSAAETALRARALGVPLEGRQLIGVAVYTTSQSKNCKRRQVDVAPSDIVVATVRQLGLKALVASTHNDCGAVLLIALNPWVSGERVGEIFRAAVQQQLASKRLSGVDEFDLIVATGSVVQTIAEARRTLTEAEQAVESSAHNQQYGLAGEIASVPNVRLRGLLHLLRSDPRVQSYVEQQLGLLLSHDAQHGTQLVDILAVYLNEGRNKKAAAEATNLSRPTFYDRLTRIERILNVDLDEPQTCFSLQVAIHARKAMEF